MAWHRIGGKPLPELMVMKKIYDEVIRRNITVKPLIQGTPNPQT